jgi:hypothetical protein
MILGLTLLAIVLAYVVLRRSDDGRPGAVIVPQA